MTPLERAARALCELISIDPDRMVYGIVEGEKRPSWMAEEFTKQSRAVLLAIREPSNEMIDAGRDVGPAAPYGLHEVRERWETMIDKALEEE